MFPSCQKSNSVRKQQISAIISSYHVSLLVKQPRKYQFYRLSGGQLRLNSGSRSRVLSVKRQRPHIGGAINECEILELAHTHLRIALHGSGSSGPSHIGNSKALP